MLSQVLTVATVSKSLPCLDACLHGTMLASMTLENSFLMMEALSLSSPPERNLVVKAKVEAASN